LLLDEQLGARGLLGCGLMLAGILVSQLVGQPKPVHDPAAA
jgi:drug/metabolite transporter (DMT)-like permease